MNLVILPYTGVEQFFNAASRPQQVNLI